jgi:nucleoside-diphosphate-sugar epimerase
MKALVVGDSGIVGRYLVAQLLADPQCGDVLGMSRTGHSEKYTCLNADLTDPTSLAGVLGGHTDISHVFYCGRSPESDRDVETKRNTDMFINLMRSMDTAGVRYQHIQLMQGLKWYGSDSGSWRTPARESDPRPAVQNFYHTQQDWLLNDHAAGDWHWSAVRPHQVVGLSDSYPHNLAGVLALYGSFCREHNQPFDFPGSTACYESVSMLMDARLLARAMVYIATTPATQDQAFNVGNSDYFRWKNVWPRLAAFFDVTCGSVNENSLAERFDNANDQWQQIVRKHGCQELPMQQIGNWRYGDFSFRAGWDDMADTTLLRSKGFADYCDSEQALLNVLAEYRSEKVIP